MSGHRETITNRLKEMGFAPKRSLGQNFLVAEHVIGKITSEVLRLKPHHIIEVGPGLGALTETILKSGISMQVIELDTGFANYWKSRHLNVIENDALRVEWDKLGMPSDTILLSNLPYQIAARMIIDRSVEPVNVSRMILMMQKEVAQRITAEAHTSDYSFLTVIAQTYWKVRVLCDAHPGDFYPPPNVDSRVLVFERKNQHRPEAFVKFVKTAFTNRRKYMMKNFGDWPGLIDILRSKGYTEKVRAEEIPPEDFVALFDQKA